MDLNPYLQFKDESTYLFCHEVSYILETGIIGYMLNILLNADFSGMCVIHIEGIQFACLFSLTNFSLQISNPQKRNSGKRK